MIKLGKYQHYKGAYYQVIALAKQADNLQELVVYQSLADQQVWVRNLSEFQEDVTINHQSTPRFKYLNF